MARKKITVRIDPDGEATVDVEGIEGPACTELTAEIEEALGTVRQRRKKDAYYRGSVRNGRRLRGSD